jgi:Zn-dependent protease/predicted transcriptional regulator
MQRSFALGRLFGIEVRVHFSWLFAFLLITWSLAGGYFRFQLPRLGFGTYLLLGGLSALLLFGSVLVHEYSHSLVARARGLQVRNITLFIFGGVSNIGGEAHTARDEFLISVVGPLTSFGLAGVFWLIGQGLGPSPSLDALFGVGRPRSLTGVSPAAAVVGYLALINLVLGVFNLIPAFPLDGGRVFRSIVWGVTNSYDRATTIATTVGQGFGALLIVFGIVRVLWLGDLLGGLWTGFIGWFLIQAASSSRREQVLRRSLTGVTVAELMDPSPPTVEPTASIQSLVYERLLRGSRRQFLVLDDEGRLRGIVNGASVNQVPREEWPITPVGRIMTTTGLPTVSPDTDVSRVLELLDDRTQLVAVVQDGRVVGVLHPTDVLRFAQLHADLNIGRPAARPSVS